MVILAILATALIPVAEHKVKVEGSTYRVKVKGDIVYVASKAMIAATNPHARDRMREAVRQSTGCNLVDDYWADARLVGKLQCPEP